MALVVCRMLARTQRDTLMAVRSFWQALHHKEDVPFGTINAILQKLAVSAKCTDKAFRVMLERWVLQSRSCDFAEVS